MDKGLLWLFLATVMTLAPSCGDSLPGVGNEGSLVGGPCSVAQHCSDVSNCLTGGDFPAGTCAVPCNTDLDCPTGTACTDKDGGHCLLACDLTSQCRSGYKCKGVKRRDKSGEVLVCIE